MSHCFIVRLIFYVSYIYFIDQVAIAKVPLLISNIEGPMEIINYGKYGYFFETENSTSCADTMMLIIQNYGTKEFMTKIDQGQKYIDRKFSIMNTANKYMNYYSTL